MSTIIVVDEIGTEATIRDEVWTCDDKSMEKLLKQTMELDSPFSQSPDRDLFYAQLAVDFLGSQSKIIENSPPEFPFDPDLVY